MTGFSECHLACFGASSLLPPYLLPSVVCREIKDPEKSPEQFSPLIGDFELFPVWNLSHSVDSIGFRA